MNTIPAKEKDASHCSSLVEVLIYRATHSPDDTAFIFVPEKDAPIQTMSYSELDRRSRCIAAHIQTECQNGQRALLLYPPGLDFVAAFFGCLYSGVVAVPAYLPRDNHNAKRLHALIKDIQSKLILSTASQLGNIEKRLAINPSDSSFKMVASDMLMEGEMMWRESLPDEDTLAFIQYTSGSSGNPKGVMVNHRNILHNSEAIQMSFGNTRETTGVAWLPLFHDMGLIGHILHPVYVGLQSVLTSPIAFIKNPLIWLQLISKYRATTSGGPNFGYEHCINRITDEQKAGLDLSCWQVAYNGAEPVRAETLKGFADAFACCGFREEAFYPCYGMAEATLFISGGRRLTVPKISGLDRNGVRCETGDSAVMQKKVSCGFPWNGQSILIVDPHQRTRCPDGQVGEIWISGPSVAIGYWNRPEETKRTFYSQLADNGGGPFLRTGDLGFVSKGELYVTGRYKDLIIIRGRNHYPQDIEKSVEKCHPSLNPNGAAAFSIDVDEQERLIVVHEVRRSAIRSLKAEEICACIRRTVIEQHEIDVYAIVLLKPNSIPKTSSGKIQRQMCCARYLSGELITIGQWRFDSEPNGPKTEAPPHIVADHRTIERWMVTKISNITHLSPSQIDIQEPSTSYGLDSVAVVSLAGELETWLGREVPPTLIYDYPTVESLARYLSVENATKEDEGHRMAVSSEHPTNEPIAVIGMGCRFPGAANIEAFWKLLTDGGDAITEVPASRWDSGLYPAATAFGGFLDAIDLFDPQFFEIAPREAECMDPQQRLLLEVTWEALENACVPPSCLAGTRTGVFIGISRNEYSDQQLDESELYAITGNALSIAANRLSYTMDLHGPSFSIDTACSSSLVAVHQACQSLRHGEINTAISGGVNIILSPDLSYVFSRAGILAESGRCRTFDSSADGYVRGEGCGIVILKRLSDALADGNPVLALIRGSAVNQDGRSNGLTAPNGLSQQSVIKDAIYDGRIEPGHIGYIEAHGSATPLGDPIEYNTLSELLSCRRKSVSPCMIGSVKTNIGHLEAAAGIASLIKSILMVRHAKIPPHLHLRALNPHLLTNSSHLAIPLKLEPWDSCEHPRIAGVSSFGIGGTNAHVLVQQAPEEAITEKGASADNHLLVLSARDEPALIALAKEYDIFLQQHENLLPEICALAATGREHFEHRLALTGQSTRQLRQGIAAFLKGDSDVGFPTGCVSGQSKKLAFLFSDQGSLFVRIGRALYEKEPSFRTAMDRCAKIADTLLPKPLIEVLYQRSEKATAIDKTNWAQPAAFAMEYSLTELWKSLGVLPDAVLGFGLGEYVAACVAGAFTPEDGVRLSIERGRLMQALGAEESSIWVQADEQVLAQKIRPWSQHLSIDAVNGSNECILTGHRAYMMVLASQLTALGCPVKELGQEWHSSLMDNLLEEFKKVADRVSYSPPKIPLVSSIDGTVCDEVAASAHWVRHMRESVRFHDCIAELRRHGFNTFLDIGSEPQVLAFVDTCLPAESVLLPSLRKGIEDRESILRTLGELYTLGVQVDWRAAHGEKATRPCVALPTYPFQRRRYWRMNRQNQPLSSVASSVERGEMHPLLGRRINSSLNQREVIFEANFGNILPTYLCDYRIQGHEVFPPAAFVEMVLAAASFYFKSERVQLQKVAFLSPLISPCKQERIVHTIIVPEDGGKAIVRICSFDKDDKAHDPDWILHFCGTIIPQGAERNFEEATAASDEIMVEDFYERCRLHGLDYGESFQGIRSLRRGRDFVQGELKLGNCPKLTKKGYHVHPVLLDAALQVVGAGLPEACDGYSWMPFRLERLSLYRSAEDEAVSIAQFKRPLDVNTELLTFDITMVGKGGGSILKMEGLSFRRMTLHPSDASPPMGMLYETTWHLVPMNCRLNTHCIPQRWLIFSDSGAVGERLSSRLRARGDDTCLVFAGDAFRETEKGFQVDPSQPADFLKLFQQCWQGGGFDRIVHLWSLDLFVEDPISMELDSSFRLGCQATLHMLHGLLDQAPPIARLSFVTRGAVVAESAAPVQPFQAPLWAMARVIATEHPDLACCCIDLQKIDESEVDALFREVTNPGNENQIAYRGNMRYAARLVPGTAVFSQNTVRIRPDASYLITGGTGGIGSRVAKWLAEQGAGTIILTGRTASYENISNELKQIVSGRTEIKVVCADVADCDVMAGLLKDIETTHPPLRGIIHGAGVLDDCFLKKMPWEVFEKVLAPKVRGAWNLHLLTREMDLDFFVCFSSVASLFGPPAQGNYAAANEFLDALCHHRRHYGLPALALDFGPWKDVGMASSASAPNILWKRMDKYGIDPIPPGECIEVVGRLLNSPMAQVVVMSMRWGRFFEQVPKEKEPFFKVFYTREDEQKQPSNPWFAREIKGKTGVALYDFLFTFLRNSIAAIVYLKHDELTPSQPLNTLGLDSIMVFELSQKLLKETGFHLSFEEIMEGMTLQGLSVALQSHLEENGLPYEVHQETSQKSTEPLIVSNLLSDGLNPDEILVNFHQLSDDEVQQLLSTMQEESIPKKHLH